MRKVCILTVYSMAAIKAEDKVDSVMLGYIKAAGLFIIGVIVGLATCFLLPYKPYREAVKCTFFSPVEPKTVDTKESKAVQAVAQESKLMDTLDEVVLSAYTPSSMV